MPTDPPQDLRRLVHSTANRVLEESLRNLRQHNEVRRLIARGELTDVELTAAYHDYERQAGGLYRQAVADLTVRYHAGLAELGVEYSRRFYEEILAKYATSDGSLNGAGPNWSFTASAGTAEAGPSPRSSATEGQRPRRVALELHAPLGSVASGAFSLENRRDEPAEVSFEVSPWRASDGGTIEVPLVISPPALRVEPRSSADVTIAVRLVQGAFALDQLYTTSVAVKGYDGLELLLTVWAEPAPAPEPARVDVVEVVEVAEGVPARGNRRARRPKGQGPATGDGLEPSPGRPAAANGSAGSASRRKTTAAPAKSPASKRSGHRTGAGG